MVEKIHQHELILNKVTFLLQIKKKKTVINECSGVTPEFSFTRRLCDEDEHCICEVRITLTHQTEFPITFWVTVRAVTQVKACQLSVNDLWTVKREMLKDMSVADMHSRFLFIINYELYIDECLYGNI